MAEDWSVDVRKYAHDARESVIDEIVRYCGVSLRSRDSSLVAFSDPAEVGLVRENYLRKKLGLTGSDADLDEGIAEVGLRMKADRTKNRVTVYYLLAEHFRKLSVFGGDAIGAIPKATAFAATAAAAPAVATVVRPEPERPITAPAYVARAPAAAATSGFPRWLPWLLLALLLLALLAWLFMRRPANPVAAPAPTVVAAPAVTAPVTAPAVAGLPANVFFDTDSAVIKPEGTASIRAVAEAVRAGGSNIALTAYTDRTGDLAHNEQLAKDRAVAVRDALTAAGVPVAIIEMRPPAIVEIGATGPDADARRVQIVSR